MSRIGKKPIEIPSGVTVKIDGPSVTVKGPKGSLTRDIPPEVEVNVDDKEINVVKTGKGRQAGAYHGLARALLSNMVVGVSQGFKKSLSLVGVGYKVALESNKLLLNVGYSHQVEFQLPEGISAQVGDKGASFVIEGIDRQLVGQTCATIRGFRPPEPYKGKGIRYADETVRQKAGKAGAK